MNAPQQPNQNPNRKRRRSRRPNRGGGGEPQNRDGQATSDQKQNREQQNQQQNPGQQGGPSNRSQGQGQRGRGQQQQGQRAKLPQRGPQQPRQKQPQQTQAPDVIYKPGPPKRYAVVFFDSLFAAKADMDTLRQKASEVDQLNIIIRAESDMDDPELTKVGKVFAGAAWALIHERRVEEGWYNEPR